MYFAGFCRTLFCVAGVVGRCFVLLGCCGTVFCVIGAMLDGAFALLDDILCCRHCWMVFLCCWVLLNAHRSCQMLLEVHDVKLLKGCLLLEKAKLIYNSKKMLILSKMTC